MRRASAAALATALILSATPAFAAARTFTVETDKHSLNELTFTSKAAIVKIIGRTSDLSGEAKIDVENVAKSSGALSIPLDKLDTGIAMRNEHMQGATEAAKFPTATFKFTDIKVPGNKLKTNAPVEGTAVGTMTLHGVTKSLTVPVELTYLPETDAKYRAGDWIHISSAFKLKLTDYGITPPSMGIKVADVQEIQVDGMAKAK